MLQGPGENAGVVDIGHGWVAVFKMESHNHPSFIEPYQGAATGVGGILRDVFTMGARPIACMDSLSLRRDRRAAHALAGRRRGARHRHYGNCVGIPTVGGETGFHAGYNRNILVNAFALGVARRERIFKAKATGPGNPILYAGSRTGRDGIHGATMASESFDAESEKKKPTVQVGDPFIEKILLEACLEAMRFERRIVAIQDMGAAGLTSSIFEMAVARRSRLRARPRPGAAARARALGLRDDALRVAGAHGPGREARPRGGGRQGLPQVGARGGDDRRAPPAAGRAEIRHRGKVAAEMPIAPLTDDAPVYERPVAEPADLARRQQAPEVPPTSEPGGDARARCSRPRSSASKEWIWRQYDHTVRTNTVIGPGGDAAVLLLKGTPSGLAMTSDVNPVYCGLDPRRGGMQAVAEAVRNLACVGAEPVGVTDCLNFGNPENPEILWQFREAVRGMSEACRAFDVPVISGNVSLYNETEGRSIPPTPTVAMVGVIANLGEMPVAHFRTRRRSHRAAWARIAPSSAARSTCVCSTASSRACRRRSISPPRRDSRRSCARRSRQRSCTPRTISPRAAWRWRSPRRASAERPSGALGARSPSLTPLALFSETQARALVAVAPAPARAPARAWRKRTACRRWRSARSAASDLVIACRRRRRSPRPSRTCTRSGRRRCRRRSGF